MTLEWRGELVAERVVRAAAAEATDTVDRALEGAARDTPVDTGEARDSLHREGSGLDIRFGYGAPHGIWIEIGANGRAGVHALRRNADVALNGIVGRIRRRLGHG